MTAKSADIALLLEGTYPYVSGGVSNWIDQIIGAYPEYSFALVFIGGRRADYGEFKYNLPTNVVQVDECYLFESTSTVEKPAAREGDHAGLALAERFIDMVCQGQFDARLMAQFDRSVEQMMPGGSVRLEDFLYSRRAWEMNCQFYRRYCADPSFVDFFWTLRMMYQPLWLLARMAQQLIPVRAVHSISTGYAGFLGGLLAHLRGVPFILSEHGIYTKERKIDLFNGEWIRDNRNIFQRDPGELSYFRQAWMRFFEWIGHYAYARADPIISLYEANRQRQIADGARAERTFCIANGIKLERFIPLRAGRPAEPPAVLCLIGRVVPIKDVKTFIRAMRRVVNQRPEAEGWIAGPTSEDPVYAEECNKLVRNLGLEEKVKFLGMQKVEALLPRIGLVVLSSISEALPLVLLEGFAAGVPAVSTDVGSCRQLIEGMEPEDRALGPSGRVVPIAAPRELADAALALLGDQPGWHAASRAAIARVDRYYADRLMFERYRNVYVNALGRAAGRA
jgi:glycosyltransferase involved in cell wall biosynthesis